MNEHNLSLGRLKAPPPLSWRPLTYSDLHFSELMCWSVQSLQHNTNTGGHMICSFFFFRSEVKSQSSILLSLCTHEDSHTKTMAQLFLRKTCFFLVLWTDVMSVCFRSKHRWSQITYHVDGRLSRDVVGSQVRGVRLVAVYMWLDHPGQMLMLGLNHRHQVRYCAVEGSSETNAGLSELQYVVQYWLAMECCLK